MSFGRTVRVGIAIFGAVGVYGLLQTTFERTVEAQAGGQVPRFEVDRLWPKPLPNLWILGSVNGVTVDAQDHIWLVHGGNATLAANEKGPANNPPTSTCCAAAPQVLEYDMAGNLLGRWGGPGQGYEWPSAPHGIAVDPKGSVFIGGIQAGSIQGRPDPPRPAGRGGAAPPPLPPTDAMVLKFSRTGQFQSQIGKAAAVEGNDGKTTLYRPAGLAVDSAANELYIADGLGNRRVLVVDATTGAYKRHWGAYGEKPDDAELPPYDAAAPPARQFRGVTCVEISRDGMVYVCDRMNNRIQVFQKDGKFLREAIIAKATLGDGAVWDLAFSPDPKQQFVYVADGHNKKVRVLRRDNLTEVSSFGQGGRLPGTFYAVGSIAVDSRGNVYTGETSEGKRIQKWVYRGMGAAQGK
jgi:DNA-binding beta-propeller fold protein YncE